MKTIKLFLSLLFAAATCVASAQKAVVKKDTIHVSGNCEMCKSNIEKAAKSAGASFALWNTETKDLVVKYAVSKTDNKKIQRSVANSGYDTPLFQAPDAAYKKLHACCQYERTKTDSLTSKAQQ